MTGLLQGALRGQEPPEFNMSFPVNQNPFTFSDCYLLAREFQPICLPLRISLYTHLHFAFKHILLAGASGITNSYQSLL